MAELEQALEDAKSSSRIEELTSEFERERERERNAWCLQCEQITRYDAELVEKENEIAALKLSLEPEKA